MVSRPKPVPSAVADAEEFLAEMFYGLRDDEVIYTGNLRKHLPGLFNARSQNHAQRGLPYYTTLCSYKASSLSVTGWLSRTKDDVSRVHFIMLDDVGDGVGGKCNPANTVLEPTAVVESSEGSEQWLYALDPPIPADEAEVFFERMKALNKSLPESKWIGDPVCFSLARLCRLPLGVNGKDRNGDGVIDMFPVVLKKMDDLVYSIEDLIAAWKPPLVSESETRSAPDPVDPALFEGVEDDVLTWLQANGHVSGVKKEGEWMTVRCPNWENHSSGGDPWGDYSPLGWGDERWIAHRGFKCNHTHCLDPAQTGKELLAWVADQGGPSHQPGADYVSALLKRYILLEYSSEIADMEATGADLYPILAAGAFRTANQLKQRGPSGQWRKSCDLFLEAPSLRKARGRTYVPGAPGWYEAQGGPYFNTWMPPHHGSSVGGSVEVYLEHIAHILPSVEEEVLWHQWVGRKLQDPSSRSYAMVMVAEAYEGEEGADTFGIGRSTVGDILGGLFQRGCKRRTLDQIAGTGGSQSAYNDWADSSQMVVVEEAKMEAASWSSGNALYQSIKDAIDPKVKRGQWVTPKYGKTFVTDVFTNFFIISNHKDALQLPEGDRRFCILTNSVVRRSNAEYESLHAWADSAANIAALYEWYQTLDTSGFVTYQPPMTPGKVLMTQLSKTPIEVMWHDALEAMPDACTIHHILSWVIDQQGLDLPSVKDMAAIDRQFKAKFRSLETVDPNRIRVNGKKQHVRIVRNHPQIREDYAAYGWNGIKSHVFPT